MKNKIVLLLSCVLLSTGCAHFHAFEGERAAMVVPAGTQVGIGSREVKDGDRIIIYSKECSEMVDNDRYISAGKCTRREVGKATILKVLTDDSSVAELEPGFVVDRSMIVEKE